jgi:hypothetical protein
MRRLRFTRLWAVVVLAMTVGLLPAAARALPSSLPAAGLRLEARDWLDHLARALGGLWKKATAETGMSIDPNGRPDAAPADPAPGADTGKSIDPNG